MENIPTWIAVVALALFDRDGRVLLARRPDGKHHGGLWEFPGGKVENGEIPRAALVREIAEELGLALEPDRLQPAHFAEEMQARQLVLFLYTSDQGVGEPVARDGQAWDWFTLADAARLPLAPMDARLLAKLAAGAG